MKQIAVAIAVVLMAGLSGVAVAGPDDAELSDLISRAAEDATATRGDADQPPLDGARRLVIDQFITTPMAPVMDATQGPKVIRPPILAGTIPEDPPLKERHPNRKSSGSKDSKKQRGFFDKLLRRD